MKTKCKTIICCAVLGFMVFPVLANETILEASKDTFGRSNERNTNNGGSPYLLVASLPNVRSIVAFDLTGITNEIAAAEFQIRQDAPNEEPTTLVVAPMVHTINNASWKEGFGNVGVKGRNALPGEATFAWRSFRDMSWETASGEARLGLLDDALWQSPVARLDGLQWKGNDWISIPIGNVGFLETIRKSEAKTVTFGFWGTNGNGFYLLKSKESGSGPKLKLVLKEES